jgi:predicted GIY-YIG superfamily endonuclease
MLYTGCTGDLWERLKQHNSGSVSSTAKRIPLDLIYYQAYLDSSDSYHRRQYLKTAYGKRYLNSGLGKYFATHGP